jgi:deoxycytidylate deaminase
LCEATHAEINALIQCKDTSDIHACYVTASPCVQCVKALANTSCQEIYFAVDYPHGEARTWWLKTENRLWEQVKIDKPYTNIYLKIENVLGIERPEFLNDCEE